MGELGFQEIILIGLVAMLFFGPKKLPELGAGIGKGIRNFKKAIRDTTSEVKNGLEEGDQGSTRIAEKTESQEPMKVASHHVES